MSNRWTPFELRTVIAQLPDPTHWGKPYIDVARPQRLPEASHDVAVAAVPLVDRARFWAVEKRMGDYVWHDWELEVGE